jgi:hypothetical protein
MKQIDPVLTKALFLRMICLMSHIVLISSPWRGHPGYVSITSFLKTGCSICTQEMPAVHRAVLTSEEVSLFLLLAVLPAEEGAVAL